MKIENYPNPFNPETEIVFNLASEGSVELNIYDIRGRFVRNQINDPMQPGKHKKVWDGKDDDGDIVNLGVYLVRLSTKEGVISHKLML